MDAEGRPHLIFAKRDGTLLYGRIVEGKWEDEELGARAFALGHGSLELDKAGQPHVVFMSGEDTLLSVRRDGVWDIRPVGPLRLSACAPVVALDPEGTPHVAWLDGLEAEVCNSH